MNSYCVYSSMMSTGTEIFYRLSALRRESNWYTCCEYVVRTQLPSIKTRNKIQFVKNNNACFVTLNSYSQDDMTRENESNTGIFKQYMMLKSMQLANVYK